MGVVRTQRVGQSSTKREEVFPAIQLNIQASVSQDIHPAIIGSNMLKKMLMSAQLCREARCPLLIQLKPAKGS